MPQLSFGGERPVVGRILRESCELVECRVHSAGARIELGDSGAASPHRSPGIEGELIPEPVEVDAFAALDQAFDIGPAEIEVHKAGLCMNLVPGTDCQARARRSRPSE